LNPTHKSLRDGTAAAHDRVDAAFAGFDLTDRQSYAAFLRAHADVVWPLEASLAGAQITPDWEDRKRGALLKEDIAFLPSPVRPQPVEGPLFASDKLDGAPTFDRLGANGDLSAIAGALYVLEGSRLGGRFLARQLPAGFPRAYLDSNQPPEKWRTLLDRIDAVLGPAELGSALDAAHRVFAAFEQAAARWSRG
jgi:heme oxygenase (biliverdin-IX-beta and delta-forming)